MAIFEDCSVLKQLGHILQLSGSGLVLNMEMCLSLISMFMIKPHGPKQLWKKGAYWFVYPDHSQSLRESGQEQTETWRQELKHRPWRKVLTGLLLRACLVNVFMYSWDTHPGVAPPTGRALLCQSVIKKMPNRLAYVPIVWRHFLFPE